MTPRTTISGWGRYRVDFALIVIAGNQTRYEVIRPQVDADPTVAARWIPIRTWVAHDWLRVLPGTLRIRARHLLDSRQVLLGAPDATVIHAFETYSLYMIIRRIRRLDTVVVWSSDGPPPAVGSGLAARIRRHAVLTTDLLLPFSNFAAHGLIDRYPEVDQGRIEVLHPGLPIEQWPLRRPREPGERFRLLFVGGEAQRKGLDTLVEAFEHDLAHSCTLHVITQAGYLSAALRARIEKLPNVKLDTERRATSDIYAAADALVVPTNWDMSSWVALEAMATGVPVVITGVGGVPEIVSDGETGLLIPPRDPQAVSAAVSRLRSDSSLRTRLRANGRRRVEHHFDASRNTNLMLDRIKALVDGRRSTIARP